MGLQAESGLSGYLTSVDFLTIFKSKVLIIFSPSKKQTKD
jgi:hypothetical protein